MRRQYTSIAGLTEADYRRVIPVNQAGTFLGVTVGIRATKSAGGGSIVNLSAAHERPGNRLRDRLRRDARAGA